MKKSHLLIIFIIALVVTLPIFGWCYYSFFSYRSCIDDVLNSIPAEEKELPPNISRIFIKSRISNEYSNNYDPIFFKCRNVKELSYTEFRIHQFTWTILINWYLSDSERLSLFVHFLNFRDGTGLKFGANHYFSKEIINLTDDEVIKLILIARSPTLYSNGNDTEKLDKAVFEFKKQL